MQELYSTHGYVTGGADLFERLSGDFIGLDTEYGLADGRVTQRHYLDSAASTLALRSAQQVSQEFLRHYANTHSQLHFAARISTESYGWAHEQVLRFARADPEDYTCFFTGSGSTSGLNRLARMLRAHRPERDIVLVSAMEHHSNDLPHRRNAGRVIHVPLTGESPALRQIDLVALEQLLDKHNSRVNYIAVTAASNVTGIINPIYEIATLAHAYGAWILVDGSQLVAHAPIQIVTPGRPECNIDFLVFSGHKIYAPGSPGVVVGRRAVLEAVTVDEIGGGTVDRVSPESFDIIPHMPDRMEPGTPNIVGAVLLACVLEILQRIGMDYVHQREHRLVKETLRHLSNIPDVTLYGSTNVESTERIGVVAFNLKGLDHGLVAAVLNDYHNVAVRNECFCAHPYVRDLLLPELWNIDLDLDNGNPTDLLRLRQGMVRASLALYTKEEDIAALADAIKDVVARRDYYSTLYAPDARGNYRHLYYRGCEDAQFSPLALIDTIVGSSRHYAESLPAATFSA